MMYWFAVDPDRPEVLDVGIRNGLWGVSEDARDEIDVLDPGDFVLFFHRDDGFVLCEVESEPYTERVPVWTEVDFPHRVRISDPVETDRYAHLGEVHDCLLDPESGEPYSSSAKASAALEAAAGTFRPLSDEEIRCLFGRLGWTPPPDVSAPPTEEDEEPGEEEEPAEDEQELPEVVAADDEPSGDEAEPPEEDRPPEDERERPEAGPDGDEEPAVAASAAEGPEPAEAEPAAAEPVDRDEEPSGEVEPQEEEEPEEEEPEEEPAEEAPPTEEPAEIEEPPEDGEGTAADEEGPPAEPDEEPEPSAPRVILAPAAGNEASRRRWEETVEEGIPVDRLEGRLPDDELERLREASAAGRVRVWGTAPARDEGSRAQWTDSGPGDVLLFTGGGKIFASSRVLAKRRDPDLAEELWGRRDDGDTWEFLFFATEPARQNVPYEAFNEVAEYEAGYRIPRLNILETERSLRILGAFPEFALVPREDEDATGAAEPPADDEAEEEEEAEPAAEAEVDAPAEEDEAEEPAEAAEADGPAEAEGAEEAPGEPGPAGGAEPAAAEAAATEPPEPAEDASADAGVGPMDEDRLRTLLFGRRELGRCALCGRLLPVELLDVVYVKPLEACDPEELEDVGNDVFPGCRLGCAGLFRQGYLVVEEGVVRPGREEPLTDPVEARVEEIAGNRCEYWHSGSEPYFRWHAAESRER